MPRIASRRPPRSSLADVGTRQPTGTTFATVMLGGVSLYGPSPEDLEGAIDTIQTAIEQVGRDHLLLVRGQLEKLVKEALGEKVNERVFGAVLGRSLRFGNTCAMPCLTVNGRILRMYYHKQNLPELNKKLDLLDRLLTERTAISMEAAQLACFANRGWGTKFLAKQFLAHLAYKGRAVFVDEDLFASPLPTLQDAVRNHRK